MASGLKMWSDAGAVIFDVDDYSMRLVGTLQLTRGMVGNFPIPAGDTGNEPWFTPQFYNASFSALADADIFLQGSVIYYNCEYMRAGVVLFVDYGWK